MAPEPAGQDGGVEEIAAVEPPAAGGGGAEGGVPPPALNQWLLMPRGPGRPGLHRVLSEPALRADFLGPLAEREDRIQYREGLSDLLLQLDSQAARRKRDEHRSLETEKALQHQALQHKASLNAGWEGNLKPDWTYCDASGYFQNPMPIDKCESLTNAKNPLLMGIYDCPGSKAPHWETDKRCGWKPHARSEPGQEIGACRAKARHRRPPCERKFAERLERKLAKAAKLERQDALAATTGSVRKKRLEEAAGEHSCLKRGTQAWVEQRATNHTFFSKPDPPAPGDHVYDDLHAFIVQPERATSYQRDFIGGDAERTSFWHAPRAGSIAGSAVRLAKARAMLCPHGCPGPKTGRERTDTAPPR